MSCYQYGRPADRRQGWHTTNGAIPSLFFCLSEPLLPRRAPRSGEGRLSIGQTNNIKKGEHINTGPASNKKGKKYDSATLIGNIKNENIVNIEYIFFIFKGTFWVCIHDLLKINVEVWRVIYFISEPARGSLHVLAIWNSQKWYFSYFLIFCFVS